MNKTEQLAERIESRLKKGGMAWPTEDIAQMIRWHWQEANKVLENIGATSYNEADRISRLKAFEIEYGLSVKHIL